MVTPVFYPRGYFPATTNTERQREFRTRNPGYYGRLHAKRRAEVKAYGEKRRAAELLAAQQATIAAQETATIIETASMPVVLQEALHAAPLVAEPIKSTPVPERVTTPAPAEPTLPPQEAMLLLMLMTAVARLQKHRAEGWRQE